MFHRRSIRLDGYDYSKAGYYFVTIDVQDKIKLFWDKDGEDDHIGVLVHRINNAGMMINYWWREIENHFPDVKLDEYVVMPDHMHGIIKINHGEGTHAGVPVHNNAGAVGAARCGRPGVRERATTPECPYEKVNLGDIIDWFKTMTTNYYFRGVGNNNWPRVNKRLWQRGYYEKIVRSEAELIGYRKYIKENPEKLII